MDQCGITGLLKWQNVVKLVYTPAITIEFVIHNRVIRVIYVDM